MARLLIKATDNTHRDSTRSARDCYKRGDIIQIESDGHAWGNAEGLPTFYQITIRGVRKSQVLYYCNEELSGEIRVTRRRYRLLLDNLAPALLNQLQTTGVLTFTDWTTARALIQDKSTGLMGA